MHKTKNIFAGNKPKGYKEICRITYIGLAFNVLLSVVKFVLGIIGRSQAVIADAVHSVSDLSTDFAILFGAKLWVKPADAGHPYGHKRIETLVTAVISVFLFSVAFTIGYHALKDIQNEHIQQPRWIALIGTLVSIIAKELLYRRTIRVGKQFRSRAVIANAWHHRSDAFSSIPVFVAVSIAAISPRWSFLDLIGALIVSLIILRISFRIIYSVFSEFIGKGESKNVQKKIKKIVLSVEGVKATHAIRTMRMGSDLYIDLHILVDAGMSVKQGHDISSMVKEKLLKKGEDIVDVVVHIEPYIDEELDEK